MHRPDHVEQEVRRLSPQVVRALQLAVGVPVIRLVRTAYDTERRAVEVCDTVMAADAYVLACELPAD
ncbi:UTRA domain-containing protein [Streptomyces coffeae]|uniref:UTRA domain-containing protein n=1 Tax=Streptomyces coffeae TaxID=621382 RepID=UPI003555ECA1